jgi:hypothetical protein
MTKNDQPSPHCLSLCIVWSAANDVKKAKLTNDEEKKLRRCEWVKRSIYDDNLLMA